MLRRSFMAIFVQVWWHDLVYFQDSGVLTAAVGNPGKEQLKEKKSPLVLFMSYTKEELIVTCSHRFFFATWSPLIRPGLSFLDVLPLASIILKMHLQALLTWVKNITSFTMALRWPLSDVFTVFILGWARENIIILSRTGRSHRKIPDQQIVNIHQASQMTR